MAIELPVIHATPVGDRPAPGGDERRRLEARARLLARGGLGWHGLEAAVAIGAASSLDRSR